MFQKIASLFKKQQGGVLHSRVIKINYQKLTSLCLMFLLLFQVTGGVFLFVPKENEVKADVSDSWYSSSWLYRKKITIDHTQVPNTDQTNFPVLVSKTDVALKSTSNGGKVNNSSGYDIIFVSTDGIKLDHEIESYDGVNGTIAMWVKVPTVSHTAPDTAIYIYYGNPSINSTQENKTGVWNDGGANRFQMVQHMNQDPGGTAPQLIDSAGRYYGNNGTVQGGMTSGNLVPGQIGSATSFDGINNYVTISNQTVSTNLFLKSSSNPMITGGFGSMWYNGLNDYHAYYDDQTSVYHSTSTDGQNWTPDTAHNPVLAGTSGMWDATSIQLASVWKEGAIWYMLYRGVNTAINNKRHIGLATSSDGINWVKNSNNPVLSVTAAWEGSDGNGLDPWGIMKVGSTYYLWYNTINNMTSSARATGLATSNDLVHWTKDASNPIFSNGRYCIQPFKYGSYYYMLIPHYSGKIEIYRDINPSFYSSEREFLGIVLSNGSSGQWDSNYLDTPSVLTNDIYRNTFPNPNLQMYYTGLQGSVWKEGLASYPLENLLNLTPISLPIDSDLNISNTLTLEAWVKIDPSAKDYPIVIGKRDSYGLLLHKVSSDFYVTMELKTNLSWRIAADGNSPITTGEWHHIAATYNSSSHTINYYLDGQPDGSDATNGSGRIALSSYNLLFSDSSTQYSLTGKADEVRVSNTVRSSDWIKTEYNNQKSLSTFLSLSSEEEFMNRLIITGSSTQIAGNIQTVTITAKSSAGNTYTSYTGDKILTLSGPTTIGSNIPTFTDKDSHTVNFGSAGTIHFTNGVATTDIKLYKAENAKIDATDGTNSTTGNASYDLNVVVSPNTINSFNITSPSNITSEAPFTLSLTSKDASGNTTTNVSNSTTLSIDYGAIDVSSIPNTEFQDDGLYTNSITISEIYADRNIILTIRSGLITQTVNLSVTGVSHGVGYIPPTKPIVTPTDPTLGTVPSNITQIAISRTSDFTNISWQPFDKDKFKNIDQTTETLYVKFRTDQGAVSDTIIYTPQASNQNTTIPLIEGDIVKTINNSDVYVIKYKNNKQYKRLILSPLVFKSYQHLKWENIKIISQNQLDQYTTSNLVKETIDTIIYQLFPNGDTGERKAQDTSINYDSDSVYEINGVDRDSYKLVK